ncbi:MAG: AMP-binding protein [Planctomycetes bacterium]|nr:AMP-binding protein [Planctomycetota bacterium]
MTAPSASTPGRICDRLAGRHLLVTGSTGFLAKALVEKLLRSVPTLGGIHLLVRPRSGGAQPEQRVVRDVLGSRVYDRLRAGLGDRFAALCAEKIHVVPGDLTKERFGLDPAAYRELARRIQVVVNSAATVTFDERLDLAVDLNTLGPTRLLGFARDCGNVPFLHVSTCYVCGARSGTIMEDFSAPEMAREKLPRDKRTGGYDLDHLVESLQEEAARLRHQFGADTELCRQKLIDAGMERARFYGWNDTYTFTKWIAEQLLVRDHGEVPLAIFRPAIIESSFEEPTPGWIDGLRMADPLIVAYGRGKLRDFPARPHIALDLIPVDFVANAIIATLPVTEGHRGSVGLYQCASSERHPLMLSELVHSLRRAFHKRPMNGDEGRPIHPVALRLVDAPAFLRQWQRRGRRVQLLRAMLERLPGTRRQVRRLAGTIRHIEQLVYFAKIYAPYTHLDCRFVDDGLCAVAESLHEGDRVEFPFDVRRIDWDDYLVNRHVPGVRAFVLGTGYEPSRRIRAVAGLGQTEAPAAREALQGESLFEVFRRSAQRFPEKPALQIRRNARWTRYTYDEALRATGTIVRRFEERGLVPGDRVVICGENGPEWGLTYLAAMRAGLTAVPLDPQLPPEEAWQAAQFAGAKLLCAGTTTAEGLKKAHNGRAEGLAVMTQPFVPPPGASRDPASEPAPVPGSQVASILFTSGTTVAPKAVQLSHQNFIANAAALVQVHPIDPEDEFLSVLPMYHAFEFTGGFLVPLACGATITYVEQLKGPDIRAAMQATGTTVMLVVPRLVRMFHDAIVQQVAARGVLKRGVFRLAGWMSSLTGRRFARTLFGPVHRAFGGHLRMLVCGGSRLDPELFEAFTRLGFPVYEGYGLTETAPVLSVNPPGAARSGSVGPVLPNVEIEIRNQNLEGIGEVWVRGPNVMSGYLNNPEATAEILHEGWLRTGDLGRIDEAGYLHLTGRSKDLIITGAGRNVYPDEVEARYRDLPYVKEICVFGMPAADGLGDVVHAVVVLDRGTNPELDRSSMEREIRLAAESISESLPTHQRIAVLHFWEQELPKTSTLKAKRSVIRDRVSREEGSAGAPAVAEAEPSAEARSAEAAAVENPAAFAAVCEILARQSKRHDGRLHAHMHLLLDLGIDSIGKMDVLGAVESRFDMRIDEERAAKVARVGDLLHLVGPRQPKGAAPRVSASWQRRLAVEPAAPATNGSLPVPLRPVRWLVRGGIGAFMNTYVRVGVRGREHLPVEGAFILAPNHSSHLDFPSVVTAVGGLRRVWVAGAEDYFFNTALKRFFFGKVLDTIAFDRRSDGVRGLRRCGEALRRGDGLLLFPEGTRSVTGQMQPFKIGVAVLAMQWQVPIVPVYIDRTYQLLPKGNRLVRPGAASVAFGPPIHPPVLDDSADPYPAFRALTEQVEAAVIALRAESCGV